MYELCTYTSLTFVLTFLGFMGKLLAKLMGRRRNSTAAAKKDTTACKLLTAKQLRVLDSSALALLMVLAFIDGFWSHVRGIATWWLMVVLTSIYIRFYSQYAKGMAQIVAISEATGSDDTKGASRWLLSFMKLIIKGLYRALIMGAVYGTLVALHGNDLKQLTPLTQVIMGAFQSASVIAFLANEYTVNVQVVTVGSLHYWQS
eukprot:6126-Heterococcus_DN1.PRE.1